MRFSNKLRRRQKMHNFNIVLCCLILTMLCGNFIYFEFIDGITEMVSPHSASTVSYKIIQGDTLWTIAGRAVTPGEDVREKIIAIRRLNGMTPNQMLLPGQVVQIPMKNINDANFRYTLKISERN